MKITERRIVTQEWYETDTTKTGWESHNWEFDTGSNLDYGWVVIEHLRTDKHGNPTLGIAEREVEI